MLEILFVRSLFSLARRVSLVVSPMFSGFQKKTGFQILLKMFEAKNQYKDDTKSAKIFHNWSQSTVQEWL